MSREMALAAGRRAAEAGMVDTCRIRRRTGEHTSTVDGTVTPQYQPLYEGRCRVQQAGAQGRQEDSGQAYVVMLQLELQLPMSVTGLAEGDEVEMLTSRHDPDLPGRVFIVRDLAHKTEATARRVQVQEATS